VQAQHEATECFVALDFHPRDGTSITILLPGIARRVVFIVFFLNRLQFALDTNRHGFAHEINPAAGNQWVQMPRLESIHISEQHAKSMMRSGRISVMVCKRTRTRGEVSLLEAGISMLSRRLGGLAHRRQSHRVDEKCSHGHGSLDSGAHDLSVLMQEGLSCERAFARKLALV
jgi:hypothetical protein